jgi:hypothetical protein
MKNITLSILLSLSVFSTQIITTMPVLDENQLESLKHDIQPTFSEEQQAFLHTISKENIAQLIPFMNLYSFPDSFSSKEITNIYDNLIKISLGDDFFKECDLSFYRSIAHALLKMTEFDLDDPTINELMQEIKIYLNIAINPSVGYTFLHKAIIAGNISLVDLIIQTNSADLIAGDAYGNTPLHLAALTWTQSRNTNLKTHVETTKIFELLLKALTAQNIALRTRNNDNHTPLAFIRDSDNKILKIFSQFGFERTEDDSFEESSYNISIESTERDEVSDFKLSDYFHAEELN